MIDPSNEGGGGMTGSSMIGSETNPTKEDIGDGDEKWRKEMIDQEEMIKLTLKRQGRLSEWINWEEKIEEHRRRIENEEREDGERKRRAEKKSESWELMRLCRDYLRDNGKTWKANTKDRIEEEKLKERLNRAEIKKKEWNEKRLQKKLMETWQQLPEREKIKYRDIEERKRRLELKEIKENLFRWRSKEDKKVKSKEIRQEEEDTGEKEG